MHRVLIFQMFPWWEDLSYNFPHFSSTETGKLDKRILFFCFLQIPTSPSSKPWSPFTVGVKGACSDSRAFLPLGNTPQAHPFWEKRSALCSGRGLFRELLLPCFALKDYWRWGEQRPPSVTLLGFTFLDYWVFMPTYNHWCVNPAKSLSPQFELESWAIIILNFFKAEQNLQSYFSRLLESEACFKAFWPQLAPINAF